MKRRIFSTIVITSAMILSSTIVAECVTTDNGGWSTQNNYLRLNVEQDSNEGEYLRFNLETVVGDENNLVDNEKSLLYSNFFSGYTTIHYDGQEFMYGRGVDITEPYYNNETKEYISNQKFGDLSVEQKLSFCHEFTEGYDDMLKVVYSVTNTSENNSLVGVRLLIDPMLDNDDKCKVEVNNVTFTNEARFFSDNIPQKWSVKSLDESIIAFGKIDNGVGTPVDSLTFANWDSLYDNRWDYDVDTSVVNNDCAIALSWNDNEIKSGETKNYTAFYGVKNAVKTESYTEGVTQEVTDSSTVNQNTTQNNPPQTITEKGTSNNTVTASENSNISDKDSVITTGESIPVSALVGLFTSAVGIIFFRKGLKNSEQTQ